MRYYEINDREDGWRVYAYDRVVYSAPDKPFGHLVCSHLITFNTRQKARDFVKRQKVGGRSQQ